MRTTLSAFLALAALAACTRSPPHALKRSASPDGSLEITLWREEAESTLDSNTYLTIAPAGAPFNEQHITAQIKRGRNVEAYWSVAGQPILSIRDFYGFASSKNGIPSFIICGLPTKVCRRLLPPAPAGRVIYLGTYHTGESEPFGD